MNKVSKKFNSLKKFCKRLDKDFTRIGVQVWFPEKYPLMYPTPRGGSLPTTPTTKRKHSRGEESNSEVNKRFDNKKTPVKMATNNQHGSRNASGSGPIPDAPVVLAAGGNVGDQVTNEKLNLLDSTLESMAINASGSSGPNGGQTVQETFAEKVKVKRVNRAYAYAAFILGGTDMERLKLSKKHFNAFVSHYNKVAGELSIEDQDRIDIEFATFQDGIGVVACADSTTLRWIKKEANTFQFDSKPTRAWARWERVAAMQYYGFLHGEGFKHERPSVVIGEALKKRGIPGRFENCIFSPENDGVFVCFEPDKVLAAELDKTMVIKVKAHKIHLGRRVRQQHSEAEFVEFMDKKNTEAIKREKEQEAKRKLAKEKAAQKAAAAAAASAAATSSTADSEME